MARLTATLDAPGVEDPIIVHAVRGREAVSEAFRDPFLDGGLQDASLPSRPVLDPEITPTFFSR
jgi:hypothetical protein